MISLVFGYHLNFGEGCRTSRKLHSGFLLLKMILQEYKIFSLPFKEVEADRELATRRMSSEQDIKPQREQRVLERQSSSDSSKKSQKSSPPSRGSGKGGRGPPKGRQSSSPRSPASSTTSSIPDAKMPSSYNRRQVCLTFS